MDPEQVEALVQAAVDRAVAKTREEARAELKAAVEEALHKTREENRDALEAAHAEIKELRAEVARLRYAIRSTRTCKQDWLGGGYMGCV